MKSSELRLDPFGFWPLYRSAIAGLGGGQAPHRLDYAFHTPYVLPASGRITFVLEWQGLRATTGEIEIKVYAIPEARQRPKLVRRRTLALASLAAADGCQSITITIEARPHTLYAVLGNVVGQSDAMAASMGIRLDRGGDGAAFTKRLKRARRTIFDRPSRVGGRWWQRGRSLDQRGMIVRRPATLAQPISQMCTAAQFDEPAYGSWLAELGMAKHLHRKQWEFMYILQGLQTRGMLRPGARGLGFGVGAEFLPSFLAARGCEIVATDLPVGDRKTAGWTQSGQYSQALAGLHWPDLCPAEAFYERVSLRAVDMNHVPDDLVGFDFCWSACAYEHLGSIRAGLDFVKRSIHCLRPGGIAIHTSELNLTSDTRTVDHDATVLFRRRDMETLALELMAEGHEVAPITYDEGSEPLDQHVDVPPYLDATHLKVSLRQFVTTSFGMIVRRAA